MTIAHKRSRRPARIALARRWWRREIVGSVDYRRVVTRVDDDAGWSPRYAFMAVMSAGIAVLGLLLSSPAVIIGAMLISPLMGPIIGLGFALAIFDWREMRRSLSALALGSALAVLFCALVVVLSPLQAVTPEILARTRPNLFDLLVAIFSALAGTYATIRGRGETIVGVAIATALMPPLAVVGYGLATANMPVLGGALALFLTNMIAIALSAAFMARFYGFGQQLSPKQTRAQAWLIIGVFLLLSVPLALALRQIAWEAVATRAVRSEISAFFGAGARVTQLDVDFAGEPIRASAVVLTSRYRADAAARVGDAVQARLREPAQLQLSQIIIDQDVSRLEQERAALTRKTLDDSEAAAIREALMLTAGVDRADILIDPVARLASTIAMAAPGVSLAGLRRAEAELQRGHPGWQVRLLPPPGMPLRVLFAAGSADIANAAAIADLAWALRHWQAPAAIVIGRAASNGDGNAGLAQARADAVAAALQAAGVPATARTDPAGPLQRAAERESGMAQFRSAEVLPDHAVRKALVIG